MFFPKQANRWTTVGQEWSIAIMVAGLLVIPRSAVALISVFGLVILATRYFEERVQTPVFELRSFSPAIVLSLGFFTWCLTSALWAPSFSRSLLIGSTAILFTLISYVSIRTTQDLPKEDTTFIQRGIFVGFVIGVSYLVIEAFTKQSLLIWATNTIKGIGEPSAAYVEKINGEITAIQKTVLNRNMTALLIFFWPCLYAIKNFLQTKHISRPYIHAIQFALFLTTAGLLLWSEHESSKLALLIGAVFFMIAHWSRKLSLYMLAGCWVIATLLPIPTTKLIETSKIQEISVLPKSARDRVYIWTYTASESLKTPIAGRGVGSTPLINEEQGREDKLFEQRLSRHAHNIFLQTWYELGAIGAILLCCLGLALLKAVFYFEIQYIPFGIAHFSAFMTLGAFSYGMWQFWFDAIVAIGIIIAMAAASLREKSRT